MIRIFCLLAFGLGLNANASSVSDKARFLGELTKHAWVGTAYPPGGSYNAPYLVLIKFQPDGTYVSHGSMADIYYEHIVDGKPTKVHTWAGSAAFFWGDDHALPEKKTYVVEQVDGKGVAKGTVQVPFSSGVVNPMSLEDMTIEDRPNGHKVLRFNVFYQTSGDKWRYGPVKFDLYEYNAYRRCDDIPCHEGKTE